MAIRTHPGKRVRRAIPALPLDELRRDREMTQAKLAENLGVNQGEISKIEHRSDLCLSTLSEYVEALGGHLELRAVFPDREVKIDIRGRDGKIEPWS